MIDDLWIHELSLACNTGKIRDRPFFRLFLWQKHHQLTIPMCIGCRGPLKTVKDDPQCLITVKHPANLLVTFVRSPISKPI